MLHTDPGEAIAIVTTLVPVWVGHEDTSLHVTQGDGRGMCPNTRRYGDNTAQ